MTTERIDHMARIRGGATRTETLQDAPPLVTQDMLDWLAAAFPHPFPDGAVALSQDHLMELGTKMAVHRGRRDVINRLQQLFDDEAAKRNVRT